MTLGSLVSGETYVYGSSTGLDARISALDVNTAPKDFKVHQTVRMGNGTIVVATGQGVGSEVHFVPDAEGAFDTTDSFLLVHDVQPGVGSGISPEDAIFPSPDGMMALVRCQ